MKLKLSRFVAGISVCCLGLGLALFAQQAPLVTRDSNVGIWRLNVAKSKFAPGPPIKSQTVKIEPWGTDGVIYTSDGVDAEGKPTHFEYRAKYDGKDAPVKGNAEFDTLAYNRVDNNTVTATTKLKGAIVGNHRVTVSADGRTRTIVQTGTNAKGEKFDNTLVYEKQ